jgi:O-methyltransferase involved in polyketide biosynthesis
VVIHEGLMPYLGYSEKESLASNIHELTMEFSGVWVTPDIYTREEYGRQVKTAPAYRELTRNITGSVGVDMIANRFKDFSEAECFFYDSGFKVERHKQLALAPGIVATASNGTDLETEEIWVMTPF